MIAKNRFLVLAVCAIVLLFNGCGQKTAAFYTATDFEKVPKIDVHFHYNSPDTRVLEFANSLNLRLVSVNVDAGVSIYDQLKTTRTLKQSYPDQFAFLGTFSVNSFGKPGFAERAIARIDSCMKAGASGIKIWKNIGMVLKDSAGRYVMIDNAAFSPIFNYLEEKNIPLMGHLGEPRNCWLPEDKMTLDNDRSYYKEHPQYHMYLHPEAPSYEDQINARDNVLKNHPKLNFIGAHLGSLEWNVDEVAKRLDQFPNFNVDMAARIGHLQNQSVANRDKVRKFMIKYQDRLLYGTDFDVNEKGNNIESVKENLRKNWKEQWIYLATDSTIIIEGLGKQQVKGLQLPREVVDKIYSKNAERLLKM
jgi:predicted TIM-barrel fold metal-dependent hydrolase